MERGQGVGASAELKFIARASDTGMVGFTIADEVGA